MSRDWSGQIPRQVLEPLRKVGVSATHTSEPQMTQLMYLAYPVLTFFLKCSLCLYTFLESVTLEATTLGIINTFFTLGTTIRWKFKSLLSLTLGSIWKKMNIDIQIIEHSHYVVIRHLPWQKSLPLLRFHSYCLRLPCFILRTGYLYLECYLSQ